MAYLGICTTLDKSLVPNENLVVSLIEKLKGLRYLGPVVFLVLMVLGAMYGGYASPS